MRANSHENRRVAYLRAIPEGFRTMEAWPDVDANLIDERARPRLQRLTKAATLFLQGLPMTDVLKVAEVSFKRFLELMNLALAPAKGTTQINGTRAFVTKLVQAPRQRKKPRLAKHGTFGLSCMWQQLLLDYPIEAKLIQFLNGEKRPNKVFPHVLHVEFKRVLKECNVPETDYPYGTQSMCFQSLKKWFEQVYIPKYLHTHIRKQHGPDAAKSAAYETGDGQTQTPLPPYGVLVIDEFQVDLESVVQLPMAIWGVEHVRMRKFPVLRARSMGSVCANVAWQLCLKPQASGEDIIALMKNAVVGQPGVEQVSLEMKYLDGAGFPQNLFPALKFSVPMVVYLDNALSHLFNPLQHLLTRLYGGRVILGVPGTPKARAHIESSIAGILNGLIHQLPNTSGTGPLDPLRKQSQTTLEKAVPVQLLEQGIDVYLANQNVLPSAGAGYRDSFIRLSRLIESGQIRCNYLPEGKRKPHHFCEPKQVKVNCNPADGRLPHVWFRHRRYSSIWLKGQPQLKSSYKLLFAMENYADLRTLVLVDENFAEIDILTVEGAWAHIPHDVRMVKLYGQLKSQAQFSERPQDQPLVAMLSFLSDKASFDRTAALNYAYIMRYLKFHLPPEALTNVEEINFKISPAASDEESTPLPKAATTANGSARSPVTTNASPAHGTKPSGAPIQHERAQLIVFNVPRRIK